MERSIDILEKGERGSSPPPRPESAIHCSGLPSEAEPPSERWEDAVKKERGGRFLLLAPNGKRHTSCIVQGKGVVANEEGTLGEKGKRDISNLSRPTGRRTHTSTDVIKGGEGERSLARRIGRKGGESNRAWRRREKRSISRLTEQTDPLVPSFQRRKKRKLKFCLHNRKSPKKERTPHADAKRRFNSLIILGERK